MARFVALLRGVNVGGHRIIPMEKLRGSCERMGLESVRTYIQSGNIVFESDARASVLCASISGRIQRDFGFEVPVVIRSERELSRTLKANPFLKEKGIEPSRLYVAFLSEVPRPSLVEALKKMDFGRDRFCHRGAEMYLHYPVSAAKTKLSNLALERILEVAATTRNWNTVNKLVEMMAEG